MRLKNIVDRTRDGLREGTNVQLSKAELDILRKAGLNDTAEAYNGLMRKHTNPELLDRWERIHGKNYEENLSDAQLSLDRARQAKKVAKQFRKQAGISRKRMLESTKTNPDSLEARIDTDVYNILKSTEKSRKQGVKEEYQKFKSLATPESLESIRLQKNKVKDLDRIQDKVKKLKGDDSKKIEKMKVINLGEETNKRAIREAQETYKKRTGKDLGLELDSDPNYSPHRSKLNLKDLTDSPTTLHEIGHTKLASKDLNKYLTAQAELYENPHDPKGKITDIIRRQKRSLGNHLGIIEEEMGASGYAIEQMRNLGATREQIREGSKKLDKCLDTYKKDALKDLLENQKQITRRKN